MKNRLLPLLLPVFLLTGFAVVWLVVPPASRAGARVLPPSPSGMLRLDDLLARATVRGEVGAEGPGAALALHAIEAGGEEGGFAPSDLGMGLDLQPLERHPDFARLHLPPTGWAAYRAPLPLLPGHDLGLVVLKVRATSVEEIAVMVQAESHDRGLRGPQARLRLAPGGEWQTLACRAEALGIAPGDELGSCALAVQGPGEGAEPATLDIAFVHFLDARARYAAAPAGPMTLDRDGILRRGMYLHTGVAVDYPLHVPPAGRLRALVTGAQGTPFTLRIAVDVAAGGPVLLEQVVGGFRELANVDLNLAAFAGEDVVLTLEAVDEHGPTVALLAHPFLAGRRDDPPRNVVLAMCDTLRADAVGCYGGRAATPHLDRLAAEGVRFTRCFAQAPWTYVSVASAFTSMYPSANGVRELGDELSDDVTTVVEAFRARGYLTAGFITNGFVGRMPNLDQGYDILVDPSAVFGQQGPAASLFVENTTPSSALLAARAEAWLAQFGDVPFFLFLHAVDPHEPYTPPAAQRDRYVVPADGEAFARDFAALQGARRTPTVRRTRAELTAAGIPPDLFAEVGRALYDAEVATYDESIGRLLDTLDDEGIAARTIVSFVSDHGEEFLEHGVTSHAHSTYNELLHVPWILRLPGILPAGRVLADNTAGLDLAPTLIELAGFAPPATMQGRSLADSLLGDAPIPPMRIFAEQWRAPSEVDTGEALAVIEGDRKTIVRRRSYAGLAQPPLEVFDLASDFSERCNLVDTHAEAAARIEGLVDEWRAEQERVHARLAGDGTAEMAAGALESLRALGYVR